MAVLVFGHLRTEWNKNKQRSCVSCQSDYKHTSVYKTKDIHSGKLYSINHSDWYSNKEISLYVIIYDVIVYELYII